jgi:hypothetical protein
MPLVIVDAEALGDDPLEIDTPPSNHAVNFPVGASFDDGREFGLLIWRQARSWSTRPIVQQPIGASFIEAMNPVAQGLTPIRAASVRFIPSRTAASDNNRRL